MDAFTAGRLCRSINSIHSASYFVPEVEERFSALGLGGRASYFAVRSAPMGAVGAATVAATFYNFNPVLIAKSIPAAWELASPQAVTELRYEIVDDTLPRILEELLHSNEFRRGVDLLRRTAEAIPNGDGRPLYAAHAEVPWPHSPHAQLWHAVTLLREHRGDGHIAALVAHELSGIEALVTHTLAGIGFSAGFAQQLRGWSKEQWQATVDALRDRGLVDDSEALTGAGTELRARIEDLTDKLGYAPWQGLSDSEATEIDELAASIAAKVKAANIFPDSAFGPRYGAHR